MRAEERPVGHDRHPREDPEEGGGAKAASEGQKMLETIITLKDWLMQSKVPVSWLNLHLNSGLNSVAQIVLLCQFSKLVLFVDQSEQFQ